jgi:hypothetical protein
VNARERKASREAQASWKPSDAPTKTARRRANRETWELAHFNPIEWLRQIDDDPTLSDDARRAARALISMWIDQQVMPRWTEALKRQLGVDDASIKGKRLSDV